MRYSTCSVQHLPSTCRICNPYSSSPDSKLIAFFKLCSPDLFIRHLLYVDIPLYYRWSNKQWKRRRRNGKTLTRLYHVFPRYPERLHLKLVLLNYPGRTGLDDLLTNYGLLTNNGVLSSSFQDSASSIKLAILCPTSKEATSINSTLLVRLPGEVRMYQSVDNIDDSQDNEET